MPCSIWAFGGKPGDHSIVNNIIARSGIYGLHDQTTSGFTLTMSGYYNTFVGQGAGDTIHIGTGFVDLELVNYLFSGYQYAIHNLVPTSTVSADHTYFDRALAFETGLVVAGIVDARERAVGDQHFSVLLWHVAARAFQPRR